MSNLKLVFDLKSNSDSKNAVVSLICNPPANLAVCIYYSISPIITNVANLLDKISMSGTLFYIFLHKNPLNEMHIKGRSYFNEHLP